MTIALRPAAIPRAVIYLALLAVLLALLGTSYLLSGASPSFLPVPVIHNGLIAFDDAGDIGVVQPDGTGRRTLVGGPGEQALATWSPDGRLLAYSSQPSAGAAWDVIVVDADGGHPVTIASGVPGAPSRLEWTSDGTMLTFSATNPADETPCPGKGTYNGDFCSSRIFVAAADGSGSHQVGDPQLDARSPVWSPDGRTIAFGGGNASQEVRPYLMGSDGTTVRSLGDVRGKDWAFMKTDWSSDGTRIVGQAGAAADVEDWDIWVIQVDGGGATDISNDASRDESIPSYARDRDAIAWRRDKIAVMEDGQAATDLPGLPGIPVWSPDGLGIATVTDASALDVMDLEGNVLTSIPGVGGHLTWQPLITTR